MQLPKINTYCEYSSANYGAHCLCVEVGSVTVWFSYKTPVAFQVRGFPRVIHENVWGPTTGKHLNAIDGGGDKKSRVSAEEFERLWATQIEPAEPVVTAIVEAHS